MKLKLALALTALGILAAALAGRLTADDHQPAPAAVSDASVIQIDAAKVAATFAKGGLLIETNNFKVQAGHRDAPGGAEIHERDTDIFYILEGSATFVTGGKALEPKTTSPGEIRGKEIEGGQARKLAKGDIIVIPNGVPHWFKEVDGKFDYFVVKVSK